MKVKNNNMLFNSRDFIIIAPLMSNSDAQRVLNINLFNCKNITENRDQ